MHHDIDVLMYIVYCMNERINNNKKITKQSIILMKFLNDFFFLTFVDGHCIIYYALNVKLLRIETSMHKITTSSVILHQFVF